MQKLFKELENCATERKPLLVINDDDKKEAKKSLLINYMFQAKRFCAEMIN